MLDKHMAIVGITGSGKTIFATKLFTEQPTLCIFINTNSEVYPEHNSQVIIHDLDGFMKAWNEYSATKIVYSPTENEDISKEDIEQLVRMLFQIGKTINAKKQEPKIWCHIFIDEIQEYSAKMKRSAVIDRIFKRGRRYGIVGIAISQRPAEISHTVLVNCHSHVIFMVSEYETSYFRDYGIPVYEDSEAWQWIQQRYHYVVFKEAKLEKHEPIRM
jgi:adenosyl cobinamide kinase/adenosyl cobinamide phosphate guanylyltransferase